VPSVTFPGHAFGISKLGGTLSRVNRNLDILGPKPVGGKTYFDDVVTEKIKTQQKSAAKQELPDWAKEAYRADRPVVNGSGELECSLVDSIDLKDVPGRSFGHVIDLPHFGKIFWES